MKLIKLASYILYLAVIALCSTSLVRELNRLRDSNADAETYLQTNVIKRYLGKYISIEGAEKHGQEFDREQQSRENPIIAYEQNRLNDEKRKNVKYGSSENTPAPAHPQTSYETIQPTIFGTNYGTNYGTSDGTNYGTIQPTPDGSSTFGRKGNRGRNMKVMRNKRPKSVTIPMPMPTTHKRAKGDPITFPTAPNGKGRAKGARPPTNQGMGMGNMKTRAPIRTPAPTPETSIPTPIFTSKRSKGSRTSAPTPETSVPTPIFTSKRSKGSRTPAPTPETSAPTPMFTSKRSKGSKNGTRFCDRYTFSRRKLQSGGANCIPNVLDVARTNPDLSIFVDLVELTNLDRVFDCPGPFTVQPPINDAFLSLGQDVLDDLTQPENRDVLKNLLLYHILPGALLSDEFVDGDYLTLSGDDIRVSVDPLEFNGVGTVSIDEITCNGILNSVRDLLLPDTGTFLFSNSFFFIAGTGI
jgi:uncharacterized surface protein with fasciclin (FAS1) repeats